MATNYYHRENRPKHRHDGLISAIAFGGFLIVVGLIFSLTPGLLQMISDFFSDITTRTVPINSTTSNIILPAPAHTASHSALYTALMQFDIGIGILQVVILSLRIVYRSQTTKIAETVGDLVFWFGAAFLVSTFLQLGTPDGWFTYWGALIALIGASLIVRAIVYVVRR